MDIERSRNGYYTVTFFNKKNLDEKEIRREFSTVGNVCKIIQNFQRVFIRFREKEEAERAIKKFGKIYDVDMAKNNKSSEYQHEGGSSSVKAGYNPLSNIIVPEPANATGVSEKLSPGNKIFHLILGNLPKNYTINDVNALVEEAEPVFINQMDETKVFNMKFCHIVVGSFKNLSYLIDKLNGFVICGEKLIAAEVKSLLEWSEKTV